MDILIPNIPPKLFSGSAIVVGYILIDDMTANEQNALGNWLMLVAQVLSTNAFYRDVMQERGLEPKNSTESGKNNIHFPFDTDARNKCNNPNMDNDTKATLQMLEKMLSAIEKEVGNIKKNII